jgi:hypothetical protein
VLCRWQLGSFKPCASDAMLAPCFLCSVGDPSIIYIPFIDPARFPCGVRSLHS